MRDTTEDARTIPPLDELSAGARVMLGSLEQRMFGVSASPAMLGRFHLLRVLGRGAMGVVYMAYDPQLDRNVAVKVLAGSGPEAHARLGREAKALARLSHPNVVTIHEVGEDAEERFVAMEYVDGETLDAWCRRHPPGTAGRARALLKFLRQAIDGLAAAHELGVVHRDVKPANMLIGKDGRLRIADFGLARPGDAPVEVTAPMHTVSMDDALVTATGAAVGTPAYMSPEHFRGEADAASDQFSLCASFFEAFYGVRPYPGESTADLYLALERGRVTEVQGGSAPDYVRRVLTRGLSPQSKDRFDDLHALAHALRAGERRQRWARGALVAVAVGGIASAVGLASRPAPCTDDRPRIEAQVAGPARQRVVDAIHASGRPYPDELAQRVGADLDTLAEEWSAQRLEACRGARDPDPEVARVAKLRLACLDDALATIELTLRDHEELTISRANALPSTTSFLLDAADCREAEGDTYGSTEGRALTARFRDGLIAEGAGDLALARAAYEEVLTRTEPGELPRVRAETHTRLSVLAQTGGDPAAFREHTIASLDEAENAGDPELVALHWLHVAELHAAGDDGGAFELAVGRARRWAEAHAMSAHIRGQMALTEAQLRFVRGENRRAGELVREAISIGEPMGHHNLHFMHVLLADVLQLEGDIDGAMAAIEKGIAVFVARSGAHHPDVAAMRIKQADLQSWMGDDEAAAKTFGEAIEVLSATPEYLTENLVRAHMSRGDSLRNLGRHDEALAELARAAELNDASASPSDYFAGAIHESIARTYVEMDRLDDALREIDAAVPRFAGSDFYSRGATADTLLLRARTLAELDRDEEAIEQLRAAIPMAHEHFPRGSSVHVQAVIDIADTWKEVGRFDDAQSSLATYLGTDAQIDPMWRGQLEAARARAHLAAGELVDARTWAVRALATLRTSTAGPHELAAVEDLLREIEGAG